MFISVSLLGWVIAVLIRNANHKKGLLKQPTKNLRQIDCYAVSITTVLQYLSLSHVNCTKEMTKLGSLVKDILFSFCL